MSIFYGTTKELKSNDNFKHSSSIFFRHLHDDKINSRSKFIGRERFVIILPRQNLLLTKLDIPSYLLSRYYN